MMCALVLDNVIRMVRRQTRTRDLRDYLIRASDPRG